jgi:hypothetical protein
VHRNYLYVASYIEIPTKLLCFVLSKLDASAMASQTRDIPQKVNFAINARIATVFLEANGIAYGKGNQ